MARDASTLIKTALVRKLRADLQATRIPGVDVIPMVIQTRPVPQTPEPYIYVNMIDTFEEQVTKTSSSTDYIVMLEIVERADHNAQAQITLDAIIDEVSRVLDTSVDGYIDLEADGFCVYIQNITGISRINDEALGATYFKATVEMMIRANFAGTPVQNQPIQDNVFAFNGFNFTPTGNRVELFDSGSITPATTYSSNNRGWDFVDTTFTITAGSQGMIANDIYVITSTDDPLGLDVVKNYEFNTDDAILTTINETTPFNRITSFRFGTVVSTDDNRPVFIDDTSATYGLRNFTDFTSSNRQIEYGITNPVGQTITFTRTMGDYMYFVTGDDVADVSTVRDMLQNNIRDEFELTNIGDYKVYVHDRAANFDDTITVTIL